MPLLSLDGVEVQFPFPPYECQKDYMMKVIDCLKRVNGVLESPTGTGKTLCLLCATLAWREHFKDTITAHKIAERLDEKKISADNFLPSWGPASEDGTSPTSYSAVPKIIYASRTHSQLSQVVNELKNTSYKPKVCVLASREQLCINPEVMRQESNHVKVHMCRAKVSTRSCPFYNNVEEKSTDKELVEEIVDMEDLVKFGNKTRTCPYYLSRSLKQQADIIFMPYNYLLELKTRKAHNIDLAGSVIIFDEAHNVERTCEESTSFDLTPYDLASAINALTRLLSEHAQEASFGETSQGLWLGDHASKNIFVFNACDVLHSFIYELLERAHLTYDTKDAVSEALEQIVGYLAGQPGIFLNTSGLQKLLDIMQVCQVKVQRRNILSYWCFSPGFSMQDLKNQGVRCIILTSGTLSPLSSFTSEMRIPFSVSLENSHVIGRDQIFVSVIEHGPDKVPLSSAFNRRLDPENLSSLGNTVVNLTRIVPDGLLLFFPSFYLMEKTLEFWRDNGHANRIENLKPMFVEPKGRGPFAEAIEGYYNKVNDSQSRGGIFAAVCRGKASEGLDFANTFGRGVIITGLPFPPKFDPRIVLKMQFLDELNQGKIAAPGQKLLSGQEWYREQAFRAVNQAIGRVIRHKDDYGAIFLCDQRFKSRDVQSHLPAWLRPYVRSYDNFGNIIRDVCHFFRVAQKMVRRLFLTHAIATILHDTSFTPSQKPDTQKAKMLDVHTSTLKRRRTGECLFELLGTLDLTTSICYFRYELFYICLILSPRSNLSTRSLQHDKRMDEMMRGVKRTIKLIQEQRQSVSGSDTGDGKINIARSFLLEMKSSLSQVSFEQIRQALVAYKKDDNLDNLLSGTSLLTLDPHTYRLYRGLYPFVRPHHRKAFDEKCVELTGDGCGFKPEHSVKSDEKKSTMSHSGRSIWYGSTDLNNKIKTLPCLPEAMQKKKILTTFLQDVKEALGPERSLQLCQAVNAYKTTDNYENMVTTVVALFTEREKDFHLLCRFGNVIRPHHKRQYKEMLRELMGQTAHTAPGETDLPKTEKSQSSA
uniref:Regulator of telomere elongation helicase 1 n=1 Tax=Hippocampus comes TaxID=109280 RepID=A0A3Q2YZ53_HIPCM